MAGIQWLTFKGRRLLLLDFTWGSDKRVEQLAREVQQVITAQPRASVRVLADFTGVSFTEDACKQIAKAAAADRAHVLGTAWVGAELPDAWFNMIRDYSQRDIRRFSTREEALEFLSGQ